MKIILALSLGWKEGTNTSDFAKAFEGRMWFFDSLSVHHLTFHQPIWKRHQHVPHPRHVPGWVAGSGWLRISLGTGLSW